MTTSSSTGSTPELVAEGLGVRFGEVQALEDVDCSFGGRGVTGLVGVNGAGKTTLIHALTGLLPATSGTVARRGRQTDVGYCPDTPTFEPWLSATEVLTQSALLGRRGATAPSAARTGELLELVGLSGSGHRRVGGFSRGMSQRLGVAASLVRDPAILFLDEPTSALDPVGREDVLALIERLGFEMRVVVSSHILDDIGRVARDLLVLHSGHVLFSGDVADFRRRDEDERVVLHLRSRTGEVLSRLSEAGISLTLKDQEETKLFISPGDLATALEAVGENVEELISVRRCGGTLRGAFIKTLAVAASTREQKEVT